MSTSIFFFNDRLYCFLSRVLSYLIHKRSAKTQMRGFHFRPINEQLIHKCSIIMTVWLIRIRPHRTHSSRELPSLQNTVNRVKDIKQEGCNIFCQERDYVTEMNHGFLAISGEIADWRRWVGKWAVADGFNSNHLLLIRNEHWQASGMRGGLRFSVLHTPVKTCTADTFTHRTQTWQGSGCYAERSGCVYFPALW